jgi:hypothetical protein
MDGIEDTESKNQSKNISLSFSWLLCITDYVSAHYTICIWVFMLDVTVTNKLCLLSNIFIFNVYNHVQFIKKITEKYFN